MRHEDDDEKEEGEVMDREMRRQVGRPLKKAESLLKKAERNNMKLADYDEKVRDPIIDRAKKSGIKVKKPPKGKRL
jgi:hypothetical protein